MTKSSQVTVLAEDQRHQQFARYLEQLNHLIYFPKSQ